MSPRSITCRCLASEKRNKFFVNSKEKIINIKPRLLHKVSDNPLHGGERLNQYVDHYAEHYEKHVDD